MKKVTKLAGAWCSASLAIILLAFTASVFRPPSAGGMDTRLVLATEEVVREMRKNGELPPAEEADATAAPGENQPARESPLSGEDSLVPVPAEFETAEVVVESSVVPADEPEEPVSVDLPLKEVLEKRVSLKYVDADIRVVLRSLARAYGFNVTLAPEVRGIVTLDFNNVRIVDALDSILIDQGLGYRVSGDIIRVTTREKIEQEMAAAAAQEAIAAQRAKAEAEKRAAEEVVEPLVVKIFKLKFIDASDARETIEPMLTPDRGKATVLQTKQYRGFEFEATETFGTQDEQESSEFVRSRILIVQDTQTAVNLIGEVIERIDQRPPQVLIDAKVLEVPVDQEFRLGIDWTEALNRWEVKASELEARLGREYEQVVRYDESDTRNIGSSYDRTGRTERDYSESVFDRGATGESYSSGRERYTGSGYNEGNIDVIIPDPETGLPGPDFENEGSLDGPFQGNTAWQGSYAGDVRTSGWADQFYRSITDTETRRNFDNYLNGISDTIYKLTTSGQTYTSVLSAADFSLMLSAMKTDSNVVVLSNPRIIVHENYAAKIFVGERYPILKTEVSGESGGSVGGTSVEEWREIGITLKVIPQVRQLLSGGDGINMIIHPAVSKRTGQFAEYRSVDGQLAFSSYPIINIREADTNVTINDGDTIVIGGLISSYTQDREAKIPLLGDIPIIGYLFKEEYTKLEKTNLLIFITARIVTEDFELSAYEKLMLEKSPPDALDDVRYVGEEQVRPYLYRGPDEPVPGEEGNSPQEEDDSPSEEQPEEEADSRGNSRGRVITKAMKRSQR